MACKERLAHASFASRGRNIAAISLVLFGAVGVRAQVATATSLTVSEGGKVATLDASALKAKTRKTVTVTNGHTNQSEEYSGVLLVDLLPNTPDGQGLCTGRLSQPTSWQKAPIIIAPFCRSPKSILHFIREMCLLPTL